ncbi:MAG TPA: DUF2147 domain-containing protein [Bradyrhizobium sp.]
MRKLLATTAFLLASTTAQAQYTFDYGGRTIRIDPDRGTVSIPGVYDNTGQGKAKKAKKNEQKPDQQAPQQAKVDPQTPAAPVPAPAPVAAPPAAEQAPAAAAPPPAPPAPPPTTTANNAPADTAVLPPPAPPPAPAPVEQQAAPAVTPPLAPTVAVAPPPPAPAPAPVQSAAVAPAPAAAPTRDLNSPLGVWLTEENEGKVRIEQCGNNLCGYSVDTKSNQNGEQVLINMKPAKDQKWSGRILDPNTGSTYDSTIALKGTDRLRVQGCAFGGMFCGGQTWTRVN